METCKLCRDRPANQTGSHIFTLSLIKSAINETGEKVRGKELIFGVSNRRFLSLYFGQKIQSETIEKILDREVSEQDIQENNDPFTIDNIVCINCEKLFQPVENYFFENIQTKLVKNADRIITDNKHGKHFLLNDEASLIVRLYFYIQVWRASVAKYNGFKLDPHTEEKLRKILNFCLKDNLKEVKETALINSERINQFPIIITHLQTDNSENVVYIDPFDKPDFFILNEFVFQFYRQTSHLKSVKKFHFGLTDMLKNRNSFNRKNNTLVINQVNNNERISILNSLLMKLHKAVYKNFGKSFAIGYLKKYGELPKNEVVFEAYKSYFNQYNAQ